MLQETRTNPKIKNKLKYLFKHLNLGVHSCVNTASDGLLTYYDSNFYNYINSEILVQGGLARLTLFSPDCNSNLHIFNIYAH